MASQSESSPVDGGRLAAAIIEPSNVVARFLPTRGVVRQILGVYAWDGQVRSCIGWEIGFDRSSVALVPSPAIEFACFVERGDDPWAGAPGVLARTTVPLPLVGRAIRDVQLLVSEHGLAEGYVLSYTRSRQRHIVTVRADLGELVWAHSAGLDDAACC